MTSFQSLYSHEFIRIASCVPRTQVAGVAANMAETAALARQGHEDKAALMVFPEHYNVNASVPKTLIQHLIRFVADSGEVNEETRSVLHAILGTVISPELVPTQAKGAIQSSEQVVGPYALQDFNLFYLTRYGFRPSKIAFLAHAAWGDIDRGRWPPDIPAADRKAYGLGEIRHWLAVFLQRFFANQFKRSALPNGPKMSSGGSLSPRSDWRAPSDAEASVWLAELADNVPEK